MTDLFEERPRGRAAKTPRPMQRSNSRLSTPSKPKSPYVTIQSIKTFNRPVPSVMIKITSYQKSAKSLKQLFSYLTRDSGLKLALDDGGYLTSEADHQDLADAWLIDSDGRKNSRAAMHLVLSAPAGIDSDTFTAAARDYLKHQFGANHSYAFVAHTDTDHPHLHAVIKLRGHDGFKLQTNRKTLQDWRSNFSRIAQTHGLDMRSNPAWMNQPLNGISPVSDYRYSQPATPYTRTKATHYHHDPTATRAFNKIVREPLVKAFKAAMQSGDLPDPQHSLRDLATLLGEQSLIKRHTVSSTKDTLTPSRKKDIDLDL